MEWASACGVAALGVAVKRRLGRRCTCELPKRVAVKGFPAAKPTSTLILLDVLLPLVLCVLVLWLVLATSTLLLLLLFRK